MWCSRHCIVVVVVVVVACVVACVSKEVESALMHPRHHFMKKMKNIIFNPI